MKKINQLLTVISVIIFLVSANKASAAQSGGSNFSLGIKKLVWYCYAMDYYPHDDWSRYSWCSLTAPNSNVSSATTWIETKNVNGSYCPTGATYNQTVYDSTNFRQGPINSKITDVFHNTAYYSHNTELRAIFRIKWSSASSEIDYPTSNAFTASTPCL